MTFYNLQISWVSSYYTPCQLNYYHLHIRSPLGYPHASTRLQTCSKYRTYHLGTVTYAHTSDSSGHSTPLVDAVVHRGRQIHEAPFHVPGHKVYFTLFIAFFLTTKNFGFPCINNVVNNIYFLFMIWECREAAAHRLPLKKS